MVSDSDDDWIDPRSIIPELLTETEWAHRQAAERHIAIELQAVGRGEADGDRLQLSRQWWASVEEVMSELYWRSRTGIVVANPPAELYRTLSLLAASLAAGTIPEPISDVAKAGKPAIGPMESKHIAFAMAYLALANAGVIHDENATETVRRRFDVKRQTVLGWKSRKIGREVSALMQWPGIVERNIDYVGLQYQQKQVRRRLGKADPMD